MGDTVLVLVGHGSRDPGGNIEYRDFVKALRHSAPDQPVVAAALEFNDPPVVNALRSCAAAGYRRIVVQPLLLFGATHQKNDIPAAINWARGEYPGIEISFGRPMGPHPALMQALDDRISAADDRSFPSEETAILLVGRGTSDPDANSEVAQLGRLFWEGRPWGMVEVAYSGETRPTVVEGLERCRRLGARRVIVAPVLLFRGVLTRRVAEQARDWESQHGVAVAVAGPLGNHPALIDLTLARGAEAAAGGASMNCDRCKYRVALRGFEAELGKLQMSDHHHGLRGTGSAHPSQRSNGDTPQVTGVPRNPDDRSPGMLAAEMRYGANGDVDWGAMWQDFCELALTGGPRVRQGLLAPAVADGSAAPQRGTVAQEIERGIIETTGLTVTDLSRSGWVGFRCADERMAVWIAAAIIMENVAAQFDGPMVYVATDEGWAVAKEVKNVITAVAKTVHYWNEHRTLATGRAG